MSATLSRLAPPPKPLAELLDAYCLPGAVRQRTASSARVTTVRPSTGSGPGVRPSVNDDLSAGVNEGWTFEGTLAEVRAAVPGTRNDTFARESFTAGMRAQALGFDPDQTIDALIEAAAVAGSADAKTADTITRCFNAGQARADTDAAAASLAAGPTPFTPPHAIELAIVKAKAIDAYKMGRLKSRDQACVLLAQFCKTVTDAGVRRELAKTVAAMLARDGWPFPMIFNAGTFLGLGPSAANELAQWAVRKQSE